MKWIISVCIVAFVSVICAVIFYPFYPLKYTEQIKAYAEQYDLSPELVAGVIYAESGYNSKAVSDKGAMGLMQLMPSTAQEIASKLGEKYSEDMLLDVDTNIRYGCYYLRYLYDRSGSDIIVLASYNAGLGVVSKWLNNNEYSYKGELVAIPYKQTQEYIDKVNKARIYYKNKL